MSDQDTRQSFVRALLWAAGIGPDNGFVEPPDGARFAEWMQSHRVTGRFAERVATTGTLVSEVLQADVRRHLAQSDDSIARERARLNLVDRVFAGYEGQPPVVVKGNSVAYNLERPELLRPTGDTDLLVATAGAESSRLRMHGFEELVDHMPHELPPLVTDNGSHVDLHAYFPVWHAPSDVPGSRLSGPHRATEWVRSSRLTYSAVRAHAKVHPLAPGGNILLASSEACALILALHIYHDAIELFPNVQRPRVRLAELAELNDMLSAEGFDAEVLASLIAGADAGEAWESVRQLLSQLYGRDGYDVDAFVGVTAVQQVAWGTLWRAETTLADAVGVWDGVKEMSNRLGADPIQLTSPGPWMTTHDGLPGRQLEHVLFSGGAASDYGFRFKIEAGDDLVSIIVESLMGPGPFLEEVILRFPSGSIYSAWETSRGSFRMHARGSSATAKWGSATHGTQCAIEMTRDDFLAFFERPEATHLALSVVSFRAPVGDDWNEFFREGVLSATAILRVVSGNAASATG